MRTNSIISAIVFVASMAIDAAHAKTWPAPFPYATDGYEALRTAVENARKDGYEPAKMESLRLDQYRTVVSVLQRTGFGISSMNVYIYGCEEHRCFLLAFRHAQAHDARVELSDDATEIVVTGSDDSVMLVVPLQPNEKAEPEK